MSDSPVVERVETAVHTVPTDTPEADGTLAWDSTTLVVASVGCGNVTGLGCTYAPAAAARVVDDLLAGVSSALPPSTCPGRTRPCAGRRAMPSSPAWLHPAPLRAPARRRSGALSRGGRHPPPLP